MKYKVGDKVRIVSKKVGVGWNPEGRMDKWLGKVMTIREVECDCYCMEEDREDCPWRCDGWFWDEHMIAGPAIYPVIVITSDGKTTTATLREGKRVIKTDKAVCGPDDTYDHAVGAKLAFERLMETPEEPRYYSGKVVCVEAGRSTLGREFTAGKIYTFAGGHVETDYGVTFVTRSPDLTRAKVDMDATFIPLVE